MSYTPKAKKTLLAGCLLVIVIAASAGVTQLADHYADRHTKTILQTDANNFVTTYGTYDATTYNHTILKLQTLTTAQYGQSLAKPTTVTQKRTALQAANIGIATYPTGKISDVIVSLGKNTATAEVFAIESQATTTGPQLNTPVDYTLSYRHVGDKWLVDNVTVYRTEE